MTELRSALTPEQRTASLQEHLELIYLFIHEDQMAWRLSLGYLAANATLLLLVAQVVQASALGSHRFRTVSILLLYIIAVLANLQGYVVMQRSCIHRQSRLARAYILEDELRAAGAPVRTLSSAERLIADSQVLRCNGTIESLKWRERIEALDSGWVLLLLVVPWVVSLFRLAW